MIDKVLSLNVGRTLKADEHTSEGTRYRDNADYNLIAPIEITLHSQRDIKSAFFAA